MKKSQFTTEYHIFLRHLKRAREKAGVTQNQLGAKLASNQSFVSKCERGERRLDIVEVRAWCKALDIPFVTFVSKVHKTITEDGK